MINDTIKHNKMKYNLVQYNTMQYNTMQYNTVNNILLYCTCLGFHIVGPGMSTCSAASQKYATVIITR